MRAGVDQVFVRIILRLSKSGAKSILLGMPLLIMVMPIFLPSAVARFKIMLPLIERMNTHYGFGSYSFFRKYSDEPEIDDGGVHWWWIYDFSRTVVARLCTCKPQLVGLVFSNSTAIVAVNDPN